MALRAAKTLGAVVALALASLIIGPTSATGATGPTATGPVAAQRTPLKLLHFNMAGATLNKGQYPIIGRIIREVQERKPDVISLNEVCDRQYAHLLIQLQAIGYPMVGYFQKSRTFVGTCLRLPDTRHEAGNAILVRGTLTGDQGYMFTTGHVLQAREQPTVTESRSVACVTAVLTAAGRAVKACSTHLAPKDSGQANPYAAPEAEVRELARVFGPEAAGAPFLLLGDLNLLPGNPALGTLYAPTAGAGQFWEVDQYRNCTPDACPGPVQGGAPSHGEGKIDYAFVSRGHFSFEYQNVQMVDAGNCDSHACSDHRIFRSDVYLESA
jgi:endonuclease/exonuclease/phosphatase family metal-dependent hydrolase